MQFAIVFRSFCYLVAALNGVPTLGQMCGRFLAQFTAHRPAALRARLGIVGGDFVTAAETYGHRRLTGAPNQRRLFKDDFVRFYCSGGDQMSSENVVVDHLEASWLEMIDFN